MEQRTLRRKRTTSNETPLIKKIAKKQKAKETKKCDSPSLDEIGDETTNSDNSDGLFKEINWEENLEVDTSHLIDEFAPRNKVVKRKEKMEDDKKANVQLDMDAFDTAMEEKQLDSITPGEDIRIYNYSNSTWQECTVMDTDGSEMLVKYKDTNLSEEWVSVHSKMERLNGLSNPEDTEECTAPDEVATNEIAAATPPPPAVTPSAESSKKNLMKSPVRGSPKGFQVGSALAVFKGSDKKSDVKRKRKLFSEPKRRRKKVDKIDIQVNKKELVKTGIRKVRDKSAALKLDYNSALQYKGKFQVGEKVLAKWSEHRMQKFPAVIKRLSANHVYDVLFYDGFEKTIIEDHLYKTTEEESAKYAHANPSEADIFVDMDADSKEARRQRKKKVFEGFLSSKDFQWRREHRAEFKAAKGRKRKVDDEFAGKSTDIDVTALQEEHEQLNLNDSIPSTQAPPQIIPFEERWNGSISPDTKPLNVNCDETGITYRSVIVPDKMLPPHWVKHAINVREQVWKVFLISPEKYKISNLEELTNYFKKVLKSVRPKELDFQIDINIIPQLAEQQKELLANYDFTNWVLKRRRSKKNMKDENQPEEVKGRVKTLLPKYRSPPAPPTYSQSSSITSPSHETDNDVWRCVKEGCDKKFRKESLLQMHIKHYHVEYKGLVGPAPNVVDLALARSEINNADPIRSPQVTKKSTPKTPAHPGQSEYFKAEIPQPLATPSTSGDLGIAKRPFSVVMPDERKSIKTMLPAVRQTLSAEERYYFDSDDLESEDDFNKSFKHANRPKKARYRVSESAEDCNDPYGFGTPKVKYLKNKFLDKLHVTTDSNDSYNTEEEKPSPPIELNEDGTVIERLKTEEVINCTCGIREEDGLMVQCDICMCWQHGLCNGFENDSAVPDRYVCYICKNPTRVRPSNKGSYAVQYFTQGKLPSFSFTRRNPEVIKKKEAEIKQLYDIIGNLRGIKNIEQSLRVKLNIAAQRDHPKLYLWAKKWDGKKVEKDEKVDQEFKQRAPVPEAAIDLQDCRINLLDHVEDYVDKIDNQLNTLEAQISVLEAEESDVPDEVVKPIMQMLVKDIDTVKTLAAISRL